MGSSHCARRGCCHHFEPLLFNGLRRGRPVFCRVDVGSGASAACCSQCAFRMLWDPALQPQGTSTHFLEAEEAINKL